MTQGIFSATQESGEHQSPHAHWAAPDTAAAAVGLAPSPSENPGGGRSFGAGPGFSAAAVAVAGSAQSPSENPSPLPAVIRSATAAAVTAAGDNEKVRANAVRALGNLLIASNALKNAPSPLGRGGYHSPGGPLSPAPADDATAAAAPAADAAATRDSHPGRPDAAGVAARDFQGRDSPARDFAGRSSAAGNGPGNDAEASGGGPGDDAQMAVALACLQACLGAGSAKVQWNACYAVGGLLRAAAEWGGGSGDGGGGEELAMLLPPVLALLRDSPNYKLRTHAAAALATAGRRALRGREFAEGLQVLCESVDGLREGAGGPEGSSSGGVAPAGRVETIHRCHKGSRVQCLRPGRILCWCGNSCFSLMPTQRFSIHHATSVFLTNALISLDGPMQ